MTAREPRRIRLIALDAAMLETLASAERFRSRHGAAVAAADLEHVGAITRQSLEFMARAGARSPWLCFLTACEATRTVVGCCGFRGNPRDVGQGVLAPEIAYHTLPAFEGRGYATAMALQLVGLAQAAARESGVAAVIAHTLRERNPSTRVLARAGFTFVGDVDDPEDGLVWRWRRELGPAST